MKKKWMKFTSMLLAAVMVLSMAMTGLAAEIEPMSSSTDKKFSITVTNTVDGETYSAYKIFDVTYNGDEGSDPTSYSYTIDSSNAWYATVAAATEVFTLTQIGESTTYNVTVNSGVDDDDIIAVFTNADIDLSKVTADATAIAEDGKAYLDLTNSGAGYYYVTTTLGSLVIIDTTNPTQEIEEKNGIPEIVKTERDMQFDAEENFHGEGEGDTSANGDTMQYRLIISNIHDVNELVIHDYLDSQLVLSTVAIDSITIYDGNSVIPLTSDDYTYNDTNTCGGEKSGMEGCSFEITIDPDALIGLSSSAYLEIIYEVTIDENSEAFNNPDYVDEIDNTANVTFGAAGEGTPSKVETFSFSFKVYKYTGDLEKEEDTPLAGASFVLKRIVTTTDEETDEESSYTQYAIVTNEGTADSTIYMLTGWTNDITEATVITTTSEGSFVIEGLHDGTYYLEETEAPDGYNKLTADITVVIAPTGTVTIDGEESSGKTANVQNNSGTILPGTGGMGTTLFYIVGIVLMIGAAAFFVARKRISKEG